MFGLVEEGDKGMKILALMFLVQCMAWGQDPLVERHRASMSEYNRVMREFEDSLNQAWGKKENLCPVCGQTVGFTKVHTKTLKPRFVFMRVPEAMRGISFDDLFLGGTFEKYIDSMQILGYTFVQVIDGKVLFRRKQ
jgi:hypothetical protein